MLCVGIVVDCVGNLGGPRTPHPKVTGQLLRSFQGNPVSFDVTK